MQETGVWSLGREDPLEKGNGNTPQYYCLGNPMDRGAWWATVHRVQRVDEVLEKTLESPLDCKEIQPGNPKGN